MKFIDSFKQKAELIKQDITAVYIAYKKPGVPLFTKILAAIIIGYALSPVDLIPDFIPILGYIDDLVLLPLGIALIIKLIPSEMFEECREEAKNVLKEGTLEGRIAAVIILFVWILILAFVLFKIIGF